MNDQLTEMRTFRTNDRELQAMGAIMNELAPLSEEARRRVLDWAVARYAPYISTEDQ